MTIDLWLQINLKNKMLYFGVCMNLKVIIRQRSLSLLVLSLRMSRLYVDFDGSVGVVAIVDDGTRKLK